jgi:aspartyl/glutamyl-tRNA(Asn/Gln) amidotransferase C subunit
MSKKITIEDVKKTAELARIKLTKAEEKRFTKDIDKTLDFFADIQEIKSNKVKRFDHYQLNENQLRTDEVLEKEDSLRNGIKNNFPESKDDYLKVKTVIKK